MKWLINSWYQPHPIRWILWPLSAIYCSIAYYLRKTLYRLNILNHTSLNVPVIIVGNITVGGTGKTPVVIWLAKLLKLAGYKPGIISRGYGGKAEYYPQYVTAQSDPEIVGDEPILISRQSMCPMVVAPNRVAAGKMLLKDFDCDIIITDDGLQHYALDRDIEIAVVDGKRLFGNQYCLPAGPLREPLSRLQNVDFIIHNNSDESTEFNMKFMQGNAINLINPQQTRSLSEFSNQTIHAVAGIGNPEQFFEQLRKQKMTVIPHPFSDHHLFKTADLDFDDSHAILMTEKDAVKCQSIAKKNMWFIPIEASIGGKLEQHLLTKLVGLSSHG